MNNEIQLQTMKVLYLMYKKISKFYLKIIKINKGKKWELKFLKNKQIDSIFFSIFFLSQRNSTICTRQWVG